MNYLSSTPSGKTSPTAILDFGATDNFLAFDAPWDAFMNRSCSICFTVELLRGQFFARCEVDSTYQFISKRHYLPYDRLSIAGSADMQVWCLYGAARAMKHFEPCRA
jgi:hypothetical protein